MLQKEKIDRHLIFGFLRDLGNPGEEALCIGLRVELVAEVGEVKLERWIAYDVVELLQPRAILVVGLENGAALDHVRNRMNEIVEDEIKPQQVGRFLGNVLRIDSTTVLADSMREIH